MLKRNHEDLLLYSSAFVKQKEYWANRLSGIEKTVIFQSEKQGRGPGKEKGKIPFSFTGTGTDADHVFTRLMKLSKGSDMSIYIILLAALEALIYRYTGNEDITVLSPVCKQKASERTINHWLLIRNRVTGEMMVKELLVQTRAAVLEAYENQDYPFDRLMEYLFNTSQEQDITGIACFMESIHDSRDIDATTGSLSFSLGRETEGVWGEVLYDPVIYEHADVERLVNHFKNLLAGLLENVEAKLSGILFLSEEEVKRLVFDLNDTAAEYPRDRTLIELFEEQVVRTPGNIAVVYEGRRMEFRELARRAGLLAGVLAARGFGPGRVAALIVEPCLEMIIGIVGVLKAGGVFLPIEPELLIDRVKYMLADSSTGILLTQRHLMERFAPGFGGEILALEDPGLYETDGDSVRLTDRSTPVDAVYTIYTSGTTGRPKGVLISNRNLVNYIYWFIRAIDVTPADKAILTSSFAFDALYTQLFASLLKGCELHVVPREVFLLPDKLSNYLTANGITYIKVTPSLFNLLVNSPGFSREAFRTLRFIMLGGEPINVKDVERCHTICGHIRMMNHYGPTEATIGAAAQYIDFTRFEAYRKDPTIGAPLDNYQAYILDKHMRLVPEGISGELCIAGDSIALGYLNQVELTHAKIKVFAGVQGAVFSKSAPWPPEAAPCWCTRLHGPGVFLHNKQHLKPLEGACSEAHLYKTGDLARWQPDGHIKLLGRIDDQIKIRGYRIELGGIESQLLKHGDIKDVVVIDRESGGERYICAYVVSHKELSPSHLKDYLASRLPGYMIPSHFVQLKRIPLTAHNKIDRQALPEPLLAVGERGDGPASDMEKKLVDIWADVLKVKKDIIGADSNFFQLGGHSLKVTLAVSQVHRDLNIKLPLVQIFRTPTIRELARFIEKAAKNPFASIEAVEKMEYYPLSSAQKRLYVLHRIDRESTGYNVHYAAVPDLDLDKERLEETVKQLIRRHESLRTSFQMVNNEPVQKVQEDVGFEIDYYLATGDTGNTEGHIGFIIKQFIRPFDLSKAPLLRMGLVQTSEGLILMSDMHHVITDRLSMRLFVKDLIALYRGEELSPLKLHYRDYTQWQNRLKGGNTFKRQESYWLRQFEGEVPVLQLPTDFARPVVQSFEGNDVNFEMGREETAALKKLAAERETTLYMVLLALFNIMLGKISSQEEIVVGTPVAARRHTDLEQIIGMFVNTLALRNYPAGEKSFLAFLEGVKERTLQAFENQEYPFEELVEKVDVPRDTGRNPLFDAVFSFQGFDAELQEISAPGKEIPGYETVTSKFDLSLNVVEGSRLFLSFEYCTKIFKKETIERFVDYLKEVLSTVLADPGKKIAEMQIISAKEKQEILHTFNDTEKAYPKDKTIHQLFEEQAERTGDKIAVIGRSHLVGTECRFIASGTGTTSITYGELNEKSNRLARLLREKGVKPDTIVGIMAEPSLEMIIGILGILKAGGAYLPIDPEYPKERINYMLADSGTEVLLTDLPEGHPFNCQWSIVNCQLSMIPPNIPLHHSSFMETPNHSSNLAYIIYTSGSTGNPKGVLIEHFSVINLVVSQEKTFNINEKERILLFSSICFDASVEQIFTAFCSGALLVLIDKETRLDVNRFEAFILKQSITHLHAVPSFLNSLELQNTHALKRIISGGDVCSPALAGKWYNKCDFYNEYGPTETTVTSIESKVKGVEAAAQLPIGKPLDNTVGYIFDKWYNLVPYGVTGELYIGGDCIARGYLNRPELTEEKFDQDFQDYQDDHDKKEKKKRTGKSSFTSLPLYPSTPLYRTGDLARWLPEGNIEFLGRIDNQVKVRGFRIELGEIETRLLEHETIKEAVVTTVGSGSDGHQQLCAYVVSREPGPTGLHDPSQWQDYLAEKLPGYMIPSYFVSLDALPMTSTGKINRSALPHPHTLDTGTGDTYAAPTNVVEEKLVETWQNLLGRDKIGIHDNFFMNGGDSIKAIQIIARMNNAGYKVELKDLFRFPTISQLAPQVGKSERIGDQSVISGPVPLTPIQYWFFKSEIINSHHFNQAVTLYSAEGFEEAAVTAVFTKIQEHHDALRMTYQKTAAGEIRQTSHGLDYPLSLEVVDFRDKTSKQEAADAIEKKADDIQAGIDLEKGPLVKLGLFRLPDGDRLLIVVHHLVMDGISWRILFEDIDTLYGQYKRGEPFSLPLKTDSFKHWAERLTEYADSKTFLKEKTHWRQLASQQAPPIRKDFEVDSNRVADTERLAFRLSEDETDLLLTRVNEAFGTEINDILLTSLALAFQGQFGLCQILIALEGHGREDILTDMDISRTVGWFTSVYPVFLEVSQKNDLARQIKEIKETLHRIPNKGIGWGILRYLTAKEHKGDTSFNLQPQVSFNYLGQVEAGTRQTVSFGVVEESLGHMLSPSGQREYLLDISGIIFDNQLTLSITYNKKQFKPQTIEGFRDHFQSELARVISFCSSREQKETTPSDFGYKKLSIEELDSIFD